MAITTPAEHSIAVGNRRITFFDAEGTLWRPRPGKTVNDYWDQPSLRQAERVFEAEPGIHQALRRLRAAGHRIVVLSRHIPDFLKYHLELFGLADLVDEVWVRDSLPAGQKVAWARRSLQQYGAVPGDAIMIGDSPDDDVAPFLAAGLRAVLVDRDHNRHVELPRIASTAAVLGLLLPTRA